MKNSRYNYHAVSYPIIIVLTLAILICLAAAIIKPDFYLIWVVVAAVLTLILNFYSVTVVVDHESILVSYGLGFFQKGVAIHHISDVQMVSNTTLAVLYNLGQETVMRITARDGSTLIVPIGDPRDISDFIRSRNRG